jgi:hypothetical protein
MLTCEGCGKVGVLGLGTRWVLGLKETEEGFVAACKSGGRKGCRACKNVLHARGVARC